MPGRLTSRDREAFPTPERRLHLLDEVILVQRHFARRVQLIVPRDQAAHQAAGARKDIFAGRRDIKRAVFGNLTALEDSRCNIELRRIQITFTGWIQLVVVLIEALYYAPLTRNRRVAEFTQFGAARIADITPQPI